MSVNFSNNYVLHSLVLWSQECMSVNFHYFWRCFRMLTRGAKLGSDALLQQFGQFLRPDISRSELRFCMKLHILVLWSQECMLVNFHDFWRCFDMLIRGANLGSDALFQQFGQFLRPDISRSVLRFCMKLHSLILWSQECMSVNFHDFLRCFDMLTRGAKLDSEALLQQFGHFWEPISHDLFWNFVWNFTVLFYEVKNACW